MKSTEISIWFFIGVLLTIYGVMIMLYGMWEWVTGNWKLTNVVLANLHAPVWWGAIMLALGLFYSLRFRPGKEL
ncbi:hypothetical protein [Acidicapsa ligni]|uniref:hypothetical protein n=1 Tax=Acidicapsa ligni TaxID=542300 RepID=UPI0021DFD314|nr:hypothetical protein [Acidicapsa ligni]